MANTSIEQCSPVIRTNAAPKPLALVDAVFAALSESITKDKNEGKGAEPSRTAAGFDDVPWILCIDDDADFSDALKTRFEEHGVAVVRAFSGSEGFRMAFTSPARVILLDFHMPNGQGDYILRRLKENPATNHIPVFILSGTKDRMLQRRLIAMGAVEFFEKPIEFKTLRARLADYIDMLDHSAGACDLGEPSDN